MNDPIDIPCVILAGGRSVRFGSDKSLAQFGGKTMVELVEERLRTQIRGPIAINTNHLKVPPGIIETVIADVAGSGLGPLAGIHSAMVWALTIGYDLVVTVPNDTPLIPLDLVSRLANSKAPAIAGCADRVHPICAIWPTSLNSSLEQAIKDGVRSVQHWTKICKARTIAFENLSEIDPFHNVNTPEDFAKVKPHITRL